jgi:2-haloacid dehalogenase
MLREEKIRSSRGGEVTRSPVNVVFDIGNVLVGWDPLALYRKVFGGDEAMARWFLANICTPEWNLEQDRGRSFAEAVAALSRQHPEWREEIAAYDLRWHETITGPIEGTVAILEELDQAGVPLYAITNFNDAKYAETRERFAFLGKFRDVVVSATERVIKPDPEIFAILCRRNGLKAGDCIFIDDSANNVNGARAAGMHGLHFRDAETLRAELRALGRL